MSAGIPETISPTALPGALSIPLATTNEIDQPVLKRTRRGWWRDLLEMIILVVIIYTAVNLTTARAIVEGPSMQPNFYTGQLIIVNLFSYYFSTPQRGDVIVLHNPSDSCKDIIAQNEATAVLLPNNSANSNCDDLIKRVIGLPNETIQITGGRVSINGVQLDEPYITHFCTTGCDGSWHTGPQQYFVLGDNRSNSYDGHAFGPINRGLIVGRAWIRYWPLPDLGLIPRPTYGVIPTAAPEATAAATGSATAAH